jgi:mannose-6-phosphate isomerase-like protein (cupin superfamily)
MQAFHIDDINRDRQSLSQPYQEFLRTRDMSVLLYHMEPGTHDPQGAHQEETLFVVIHGAATMVVGDDEVEVRAGSVVHVPPRVPPRFTAVHSALDVLVMFAPPESMPTIALRGAV